ncbi:MAG: peptidoglycan-binding protein [Syntrophothermus sp.]|uniref:peptidoglycan-binding protein n=1 Tax=Syntrophothermus sp. TaxID=2736299 RepID=UPI00258061D8|nr:peptidoglycan-binding protein [Syntrophothermus sp.]NSW82019.1 peptidoglycan-binding protein [Syntrophothermus sp.]
MKTRQVDRYIGWLLGLCLASFLFVGFFLTGQALAQTQQRNLYVGCEGEDVARLQNTLNLKGYYCGPADQKFGVKTQKAVFALQQENACRVDGIVGPETRKALDVYQPRLLFEGCTGSDVTRLQETLKERGYLTGDADGKFGPETRKAVLAFQKANSLEADGIVGPLTRQALAQYKETNSSVVSSRGGSEPMRYIQVLDMKATGYCPCNQCNYPWGGRPSALGLPLQRGIAAVDPTVIKLGTRLYVEGYGEAIAADTGGAIKGNRIDLCFDTHSEALDWGIQNVKVYVLPD